MLIVGYKRPALSLLCALDFKQPCTCILSSKFVVGFCFFV